MGEKQTKNGMAVKARKSLKGLIVVGAVAALVGSVALPAFTGNPATAAPTQSLQQIATEESQSILVSSEVTSESLDRTVFTATSQDEIDEKKAKEAAAAAAAAAQQQQNSASNFNTGGYALVSPGSGEVRYPLPGGSYYVSRTVGGAHQGADMVAASGTPIYATAAGTVTVSQDGGFGGYGVAVVINHNIGGTAASSLYAHMIYGSRQVQVGQHVEAGQLIGYVGNTGNSYGAHLHFEVRINGGLVEPIGWLAANAG